MPVPQDWRIWLARWKEISPEWGTCRCTALEHGDFNQQYSALQLGYEAWGEGYDEDIVYAVTPPGGVRRVIKPLKLDIWSDE